MNSISAGWRWPGVSWPSGADRRAVCARSLQRGRGAAALSHRRSGPVPGGWRTRLSGAAGSSSQDPGVPDRIGRDRRGLAAAAGGARGRGGGAVRGVGDETAGGLCDDRLSGGGEGATLRQGLAHRLPEYMVPAVILTLAQLPLSPNGKVDRTALPAPEAESQRTGAYEAPRTETEQTLAGIWAQVLGLSRVGRHDNFFELGGDSINSLQILARAHRAGIQLTPKQLFDHPTIAAAATVALVGSVTAAESVQEVADPSRITDVELTDDDMQNLLAEIE
ncbi:MAG: phosphopantetheine-binding protein [Nitrospirales bacterium]|nr:phosphopantetheine-binding protein [Nitrospirales bacterium]